MQVETEEDDDIQEVVAVKPEPKESVAVSHHGGGAVGNVVESEAVTGDMGYENQEVCNKVHQMLTENPNPKS